MCRLVGEAQLSYAKFASGRKCLVEVTEAFGRWTEGFVSSTAFCLLLPVVSNLDCLTEVYWLVVKEIWLVVSFSFFIHNICRSFSYSALEKDNQQIKKLTAVLVLHQYKEINYVTVVSVPILSLESFNNSCYHSLFTAVLATNNSWILNKAHLIHCDGGRCRLWL